MKISTDELFRIWTSLWKECRPIRVPRFGVRFWNWEDGPLLVRFFKNILLGPLIVLSGWRGSGRLIADALGWIALPEGNAGTQTIFALGGVGVPLALVAAYYFHRPVRALTRSASTRSRTTLCFTARAGRSCGASSGACGALARPASGLAARIREKPDQQGGAEAEAVLPLCALRAGRGGAGDDGGAVGMAAGEFAVRGAAGDRTWTLAARAKMHELAAAPQGFGGASPAG